VPEHGSRGERQAPLFQEEPVKMPVDEEQEDRRSRRKEDPGTPQSARGQADRDEPDEERPQPVGQPEIEVAGKSALAGQPGLWDCSPGDIRPDQPGERPSFEVRYLKGLEPVAELHVFDGRKRVSFGESHGVEERLLSDRAAAGPERSGLLRGVLMDIVMKEVLELRQEIPLRGAVRRGVVDDDELAVPVAGTLPDGKNPPERRLGVAAGTITDRLSWLLDMGGRIGCL